MITTPPTEPTLTDVIEKIDSLSTRVDTLSTRVDNISYQIRVTHPLYKSSVTVRVFAIASLSLAMTITGLINPDLVSYHVRSIDYDSCRGGFANIYKKNEKSRKPALPNILRAIDRT